MPAFSSPRLRNFICAAIFSVVSALAAPALAAAAADTYADEDSASNTPPCTLASPCQQIGTAIADTSAGGTVHVDRGSYSQQVTLGDGKSMLGGEFTGVVESGRSSINGSAGAALTIAPTGAGMIQGLQLVADGAGIRLNGAALISGNLFTLGASGSNGVEAPAPSGQNDSAVIEGNRFVGSPSLRQDGVELINTGAAIRDNRFESLFSPVELDGPSSDSAVERNTITGTHQDAGNRGVGIGVFDAIGASLTGNVISSPGGGLSNGIEITEGSAALGRNVVSGHATGILLNRVEAGVTLNSDLVLGSARGVEITGQNPGAQPITATNLTAVENTEDVFLAVSLLNLDSSIVGVPITTAGGGTCQISFSRGPTTSGTPCQTFQTAADPGFVNPAVGNYHLAPGSAMVDAGNPAAPLAGVLDMDGGARAVDADGACPVDPVRDIGADELAATEPTCGGSGPAPTPQPPKKCKKGQKLKKGKCVKKRRKKRK